MAKLCGTPSKVLDPNIKEKVEILYESVLDHLIVHQQELSMPERVKLLQSLSGYILAKTKPIRDEFTIQKLIDRENTDFMDRGPHPTT